MATPAFELATLHGLGFSFLLGVFLVIVILIISWMSYLGTVIWKWIDEAPKRSTSPISTLLKRVFPRRSYDNVDRYFRACAITLATPVVIWLVLSYVTFTLVVVTMVLMAFLTRYVRRLHKHFTKHVNDKDAHK